MPEPQKILLTVERATEFFRATPGRKGGVITLQDAEEVLVVGDLHGNIPAFRKVLKLVDFAAKPKRLVLQELVHGPHSYPDDGGDRSHQLVDLVSALKCQYPDRVHVILGNHELSEMTGRSIAKGGIPLNALYLQGLKTAYGEDWGDRIYKAHLQLFAALPLMVRLPNRVLLCHTIPDPLDLDRLDLSVLDLDLWPAEAMARGGTVYALTWGRNIEPENIDKFAQLIDADLFVTGHQPCDDGFRQANHRQLIVNGTDPFPAACLIQTQTPATIESLLTGVKLL